MGQKVHPKIFRIGPLYTWNSKWFSEKDYSKLLKQDVLIRRFLEKKLKEASLDKIVIERSANSVTVTVHSGKPGIIIGRGGSGAEDLKKEMKRKFLDPKANLNLNIVEVSKPNLSAAIVAQGIAADIEKRIPYRKVMKQVIGRVEKAGSEGIKVTVAGRLNGAEIARTETLSWGRIPLHTLRADIDFCQTVANTIYGVIGVKVWIYKGEIFKKKEDEAKKLSENYPINKK